jgi:hypothetical protein
VIPCGFSHSRRFADSNLVSGAKEMATKVYVNDKHEATIVCEKCGKWRNKNVSPFINANRPLKIKCNCEHVFNVFLEVRNFYRKDTHLNGVYTKVGGRKYEEILIIEDISQGGIRFQTKYKHDIKIGDVLRIKFALDNKQHSEICKHVLVRYIHDRCIGTQFCVSDTYAYKKEIGSYLMAN